MRISYGLDNIGYGRHSRVFVSTVVAAARSEDVGQEFAMKKASVTNHVRHPMLLHEACALVLLRGHPSIPKVVAWGRSQYFEYLVMDLLGTDLGKTLKETEPQGLTLRNVVVLICQMVDVLEHIHEKGIVHCDIKPGNFIFGTGEHAGRLHLIDFGLSRPWADPSTGQPFPEDSNFGFRGTLHYASRHAHLEHTPSRRDDLESLAYIVVKLLTGTLPWADTKKTEDLLPILFAHNGQTLCEGYDDVFARFVDYALSLQYDETPKYQHWREAFRELVPGLSADALFNPDDSSEPRVGVPVLKTSSSSSDAPARVLRCEDYPRPAEREDSDPSLQRVLGGASRSKYGGRHDFVDNWGSSWSCGSAIRTGDLFGDEFAIVTREGSGVEFVDAPPDYIRGSAVYPGFAPPEEMKNVQSDSRCI